MLTIAHIRAICLGLLACVATGAGADALMGTVGGDGGNQFSDTCPAGQNLGGFELRVGIYFDAIRPACVVSYGAAEIDVPPAGNNWHGGKGGGSRWLMCPASTPIVIGVDLKAEGVDTITINGIHLFCGLAVASQTAAEYPSAVYEGPPHGDESTFLSIEKLPDFDFGKQRCPQGQVAIGVYGRSGDWLDAMGLICGAPRLAANTGVKGLGRVTNSPTFAQTRPICEVAAEARARNSPAAPGLEAQCNASKTAKPLGRATPPYEAAATRPVCDVAREARARNSPAAPGLESQCRAELATRGQAIANQDPLSAELRTRARNDLSRRGFDIGMAVAEGSTEPGPGKQAMHDALSGDEQAGFDAAVAFSLQRNRNAKLAATGAAIARMDPAVAKARTASPDVMYWLGFDIATGLFGDPALGAAGNTAVGSGSLKIRNALSPAGQQGFNDAVAMHLRRTYQPAPAVVQESSPADVQGLKSEVVISQVFGGGGSAGAAFANDFVEILNLGGQSIDIDGWSIQYASATGASWQVTPLSGTILAGHYFLIQEAGGEAPGNPMPAPDLTGRILLAASAGKIALTRTTVPLSGICAAGADVVDFMGYGNANCAEGAPTPGLDHATAALRNDAGCVDTNVNAADFQLASPQPRSQVTPPPGCQRR